MRLLLVTQAIDLDDPSLSVYHSWVAGLSSRFESTQAICLKLGRYQLPANVQVHSLGKERGRRSRIAYAITFLKLAWRLRGKYDVVFVHMNQEYVLIAGWLWRLLGKKLILWRNHKMGSFATTLAGSLAHTVCYTSPSAFAKRFKNSVQMPIGIHTERFTPPQKLPPPESILLLGRLDPVKKVEVFIDALKILADSGVSFHATSYGEPTVPGDPYAEHMRQRAESLVAAGKLSFHPGVKNEETPRIYGEYATYVNLTPSGSFDKTIGEAMSCGCVVVCVNDAVRGAVRSGLVAQDGNAQDVARALQAALSLSAEERAEESRNVRSYVEREHGFSTLLDRVVALVGK